VHKSYAYLHRGAHSATSIRVLPVVLVPVQVHSSDVRVLPVLPVVVVRCKMKVTLRVHPCVCVVSEMMQIVLMICKMRHIMVPMDSFAYTMLLVNMRHYVLDVLPILTILCPHGQIPTLRELRGRCNFCTHRAPRSHFQLLRIF
jgi:hypothetical protein